MTGQPKHRRPSKARWRRVGSARIRLGSGLTCLDRQAFGSLGDLARPTVVSRAQMGLRLLEQALGLFDLALRARMIGDDGPCRLDRLAGIAHLLVGHASTCRHQQAQGQETGGCLGAPRPMAYPHKTVTGGQLDEASSAPRDRQCRSSAPVRRPGGCPSNPHCSGRVLRRADGGDRETSIVVAMGVERSARNAALECAQWAPGYSDSLLVSFNGSSPRFLGEASR